MHIDHFLIVRTDYYGIASGNNIFSMSFNPVNGICANWLDNKFQ